MFEEKMHIPFVRSLLSFTCINHTEKDGILHKKKLRKEVLTLFLTNGWLFFFNGSLTAVDRKMQILSANFEVLFQQVFNCC